MFNKEIIYAISVLAGSIIGVGLFGLPYITAQVGFWMILAYFLVLGGVMIAVNLIYGEITLRTKKSHRLPGYAQKYLGPWAKKTSLITNSIGIYGSCLAYIIIGGHFLALFLEPVLGQLNSILGYLIFFSLGAVLVFFGIKSIAKTELIGLIVFFVILIILGLKGFGSIQISNLFNFNLDYFFLPYGPILFSLCGLALVPEVREILKENPKNLKKVLIFSILIAIITYIAFIVLITGITGSETSPDAILGLKGFWSNGFIYFILIFGILTTFTSFITLSLTLKKIFWYDFDIPKNIAWALAMFVPLILLFCGLNDFIGIIGLIGGVFLGIDVILIIFIFLKSRKKSDQEPAYQFKIPSWLSYGLIIFFVIGALLEFFYFFKN